jgi:hypothetical protein
VALSILDQAVAAVHVAINLVGYALGARTTPI